MSGKASRDRGKRGETEARNLLLDRDWDVDDLTDGASCADFTAIDPQGVAWSWEVKKCKLIDVPRFTAQSKRNCGRKRWGVLAHIHNTGSWLVLRQGERPAIWHK